MRVCVCVCVCVYIVSRCYLIGKRQNVVGLTLNAFDLKYVHIELNVIPMVVTLVLIIIKMFLFSMSN